MSKCTCELCELNKLITKASKSNDIKFVKETLEKFSALYFNVEGDRAYYKSIVYGTWPEADKVIKYIRTKKNKLKEEKND